MKRKHLRFGQGFRVALGNAKSQAAEMVIPPGDSEGGSRNRHRGADQWLYVVAGEGLVKKGGRHYPLRAGSLVLIEAGDQHEVRNTGSAALRTLNFYVPPAFDAQGEPLPRGRK